MKPLDIFKKTSGRLPALLVATKLDSLKRQNRQNIIPNPYQVVSVPKPNLTIRSQPRMMIRWSLWASITGIITNILSIPEGEDTPLQSDVTMASIKSGFKPEERQEDKGPAIYLSFIYAVMQ